MNTDGFIRRWACRDRRRVAWQLVCLVTGVANAAAAQGAPLSLDAALREAEQHAFANRAGRATTEAAVARARLPLQGILPTLRVESGVVRTADPIGAFGATLRQRAVTPANFAPARLNAPPPITNVQAGMVIEVPVFNATAWLGRRAGRAAAEAAGDQAAWTALGVRGDVVRAYYGAVLAREQVAALDAAQRAAESALRQVQALVRQGMVTKADALQAEVRAVDVASQLLGARNAATSAVEQLSVLLGRRDGSVPALPDSLPSTPLVRALAERDTAPTTVGDGAVRSDVRAADQSARAADAERRRAGGALLPSVNGFARYDWFAPVAPFAGRPSWTVGVMASLALTNGGRELAEMKGAAANQRAARAGVDALVAQERAERAAARRAVVLALQQLDLATRVAEQSREAQRLVQKRYAGGLATIAERLGADADATARTLAQLAARYAVIDALATALRAPGGDPAQLRALDVGR